MNIPKAFIAYLVDFINEELARGNLITIQTIQEALEAYEGGAR